MKNLINICLLCVAFYAAHFSRADTLTATAGQKATIQASADGTQPFTYQWKKNGVNITGATLATYTINALSVADAGNYTVTVANSAGSATSLVASVLTVIPPVVSPSNVTTKIVIVIVTP